MQLHISIPIFFDLFLQIFMCPVIQMKPYNIKSDIYWGRTDQIEFRQFSKYYKDNHL
jgi:hypothetical protein